MPAVLWGVWRWTRVYMKTSSNLKRSLCVSQNNRVPVDAEAWARSMGAAMAQSATDRQDKVRTIVCWFCGKSYETSNWEIECTCGCKTGLWKET
jgi:hypothetical protein